MRNLKRVLSLAMAAAMLIGMMVISAGAASTYEDFTDKDEIQNTEAVNTMVSLGVINGKDDGSYFDPNGIVTRAEMAALIARCLNGGIDPSLGTGAATTSFTDTKGHWAEAYIAYCANLGIINGKGDGTFGPDEQVTGTAAAKMFLCALGYRSEIEGLTGAGWDLNTDSLANKTGLYDGLGSIRPSDGLNRDNTAQLVYNGVQANEVQYRNNYGEYSGVIYPQPNGTILVNRFKVRKVTGILEANDTLSVANSYSAGGITGHGNNAVALDGESLLRVTDVSGYNRSDYAGLYNDQTYKIDTPNEMVGQEIVIYVKYLNDLSPNAANSTVLGDAIITDKNTVVETNGRLKDADAVRSAIRAGGLSNLGSPAAFKFDHNGRSAGIATGITDTLTTQTDKTRSAGVLQRFIDNNGNGTPDYIIQIMPSLATITTVNSSSEKYTFSAPIGSQSWADVVSDGELAKDDILLVTKYSDGKFYVEEPEIVEGKITAFNTGNNKVTVDGTAYGNGAGAMLSIPGATAALSREMIDGTYALYLDAFGNVLGYKEVDAAIGNYAILRGYTSSGSTNMGYSFRVKLLMQDGTTGTFDLNVADTAVKLGLANASDSTSVKEAALVNSGNPKYFSTDNSTDPAGMANHLYSYSLDNNVVTLSYPDKVNSRYYRVTVDDQSLSKNTSSYNVTSPTPADSGVTKIVADSNTVFFFKHASDWTVVTGLDKLSTSAMTMASDGEGVYYKSSSTATRAAKAVFATLDNAFTANRSYVYVSGNYTESSDNGTPVYVYPVVFSDGTTGTLSSKSNNASKERVWEYETDGNYVKFHTPPAQQYNARIDWIGNGSVGLVNVDDNAPIDSFVVNSSTLVWDVQDTDNVTSSTLSENNIIALIQDANDYTVKAVFIYDNAIGDLAGNVGTLTLANGTNAINTNVTDGNVLGGSAAVADAVAGEKLSMTYTATAEQEVTIKIGGEPVVDGVKSTGSTITDAYTLTQDDIDAEGIVVSVTVKEADKDTFTKEYTVSVAGPVVVDPAGDPIDESADKDGIETALGSSDCFIEPTSGTYTVPAGGFTVPAGKTLTIKGNLIEATGNTITTTGDGKVTVTGTFTPAAASAANVVADDVVLTAATTISGNVTATNGVTGAFALTVDGASAKLTTTSVANDLIVTSADTVTVSDTVGGNLSVAAGTVNVKDVTGTVALTGGTLNVSGTTGKITTNTGGTLNLNGAAAGRAAGVTVADIEMNAGSLNVTGAVTITKVTKLSTPVVKADATLTITQTAPVAELEKLTGEDETATLVLSAASTGSLTGTAANGDAAFWLTAGTENTTIGTADDGAVVSAGTYKWGTAYYTTSATADTSTTAWIKQPAV